MMSHSIELGRISPSLIAYMNKEPDVYNEPHIFVISTDKRRVEFFSLLDSKPMGTNHIEDYDIDAIIKWIAERKDDLIDKWYSASQEVSDEICVMTTKNLICYKRRFERIPALIHYGSPVFSAR